MSDARPPAPFRHTLIYALTLLSLPGYAVCLRDHVCMDGHMRHPPYSAAGWAMESGWIACMVGAAVFALRASWRRRALVVAGLVVLLVSRLALGSLGGAGLLFEGPVALPFFVWSLLGLWRSLPRPGEAPPGPPQKSATHSA